jgi:GTPase Era involved in 16S rRNA processing
MTSDITSTITSTLIPKFAVVGHPNKGKSSIVSTLVESSGIQISNIPGTTVDSEVYAMRIKENILYELVDTPGFQRPRKVLAWLQENSKSAEDRPQTVAKFVEAHNQDKNFHDECELLKPLLEGAGILYVVDGSKPYGIEYEAEMEILRWTGRPRMALINLISEGDYVDEWRTALDQYFAIVRVFDAMRADASKRIGLLKSFAELNEAWQPSLHNAVNILEADQTQRRKRSAKAIAGLLTSALTAKLSKTIAEGAEPEPIIEALTEKLKQNLRELEQKSRKEIEYIYRHQNIERQETMMEFLDLDLFSSETSELFGLSKSQIITSGAASGAVAGLGVDVMLGGASLLLGSGIGAFIGGVSALFGSEKIGKIKVLGKTLTDRNLNVGPVKDVNLPYILLSRALMHHQLVSERNHALREALVIEVEGAQHISQNIPDNSKKQLDKIFSATRQRGYDSGKSLRENIETLLIANERIST